MALGTCIGVTFFICIVLGSKDYWSLLLKVSGCVLCWNHASFLCKHCSTCFVSFSHRLALGFGNVIVSSQYLLRGAFAELCRLFQDVELNVFVKLSVSISWQLSISLAWYVIALLPLKILIIP